MTIRRDFISAPSICAVDGSPRKKSIHTELSTNTLVFSSMPPYFFKVSLFGFSPSQVHEATAGQRHELVHPFSAEMAFDRAAYRLRPAYFSFDAHQFFD